MVSPLESPGNLASAELVVVSDVHLRAAGDSRYRILLELIGQISKTTEYFVLNGDIFDFCFGDSAFFREKFHEIGEALDRLAKTGVKVVFIEGNHEFHIEELGWTNIEIITTHSRPIKLRSGVHIKIGHGDLITDDPLYRAFRGFVKSGLVRQVAKRLPGHWLDAYALRHALLSRSRDKYRTLDHHRILRAFGKFLGDDDYDHGIIGHFHVPYAEKRETSDGWMLSVESWDQPNALTFAGGHFYRIFFDKSVTRSRLEPAESIFKEGTQH